MCPSNLQEKSDKKETIVKIQEPTIDKFNQKQKTKNIKGHWTGIQQLRYFLFLYHHKDQFAENQIRRSLRLFKCMAIFIQTRSPGQCRTHNQKTIQKFGGIKESIKNFIAFTPKFFQKYEKVRKNLQILDDIAFCGDFQSYKQLIKSNSQNLNINEKEDAKQRQQNQNAKIQQKEIQKSVQPTILNQYQNSQQIFNSFQIFWQPYFAIPSIIYIKRQN